LKTLTKHKIDASRNIDKNSSGSEVEFAIPPYNGERMNLRSQKDAQTNINKNVEKTIPVEKTKQKPIEPVNLDPVQIEDDNNENIEIPQQNENVHTDNRKNVNENNHQQTVNATVKEITKNGKKQKPVQVANNQENMETDATAAIDKVNFLDNRDDDIPPKIGNAALKQKLLQNQQMNKEANKLISEYKSNDWDAQDETWRQYELMLARDRQIEHERQLQQQNLDNDNYSSRPKTVPNQSSSQIVNHNNQNVNQSQSHIVPNQSSSQIVNYNNQNMNQSQSHIVAASNNNPENNQAKFDNLYNNINPNEFIDRNGQDMSRMGNWTQNSPYFRQPEPQLAPIKGGGVKFEIVPNR